MIRPAAALSVLALGSLSLAGCVFVTTDDTGSYRSERESLHHHAEGDHDGAGSVAMATLEAKSGSGVAGSATLTELDGGLLVEMRITNTAPGWHAAHIHETGDCSSPDGKSAGGHFNPEGVMHGAPHAAERHAGDLGNLWVDEHGNGTHILFMPDLSLDEGPTAVRGRAIILHTGADDLVSQPTGAAGGRIACGVIR